MVSCFISLFLILGCALDSLDWSEQVVAFCFILLFPICVISVYLVSEDGLSSKRRYTFPLEYGQVIFRCREQEHMIWEWQMPLTFHVDKVQLKSMVVLILCGTISLVRNLNGDFSCSVPAS